MDWFILTIIKIDIVSIYECVTFANVSLNYFF